MRVWYQTKAWIEQFFSTAVESEVPTAHHSLATKLPQEIVDIAVECLRIVQRTGAKGWSDVTYDMPVDLHLPALGLTVPHDEIFARD